MRKTRKKNMKNIKKSKKAMMKNIDTNGFKRHFEYKEESEDEEEESPLLTRSLSGIVHFPNKESNDFKASFEESFDDDELFFDEQEFSVYRYMRNPFNGLYTTTYIGGWEEGDNSQRKKTFEYIFRILALSTFGTHPLKYVIFK